MSRLKRIVAACGGLLLDNGRRALIPGPGHSAKDRSVSLLEAEDGRILIKCFSPRDNWRDVRRALAERGLLDQADAATALQPRTARERIAAQPALEDRLARARRLWEESRPFKTTIATRYLCGRAIDANALENDALRFHPRMTSLDDRKRRPAFMAALRDATGDLLGVQVTLLSAHGSAKACVSTPRRVIGKLLGGAVRLSEPGDELAIGEGVETMLSASAALGLPAWAALTADNLARFTPPAQVKRLVIARDNGAAGERAAAMLVERLSSAIRMEIAAPPLEHSDWNDWARAARHARRPDDPRLDPICDAAHVPR